MHVTPPPECSIKPHAIVTEAISSTQNHPFLPISLCTYPPSKPNPIIHRQQVQKPDPHNTYGKPRAAGCARARHAVFVVSSLGSPLSATREDGGGSREGGGKTNRAVIYLPACKQSPVWIVEKTPFT